MRRLVLVRHCESTGLHPEAALTARGLEQARALAVRLEIDARLADPLECGGLPPLWGGRGEG